MDPFSHPCHDCGIDTPTAEADGILLSQKPLKPDTLRCLIQRWDSPEA